MLKLFFYKKNPTLLKKNFLFSTSDFFPANYGDSARYRNFTAKAITTIHNPILNPRYIGPFKKLQSQYAFKNKTMGFYLFFFNNSRTNFQINLKTKNLPTIVKNFRIGKVIALLNLDFLKRKSKNAFLFFSKHIRFFLLHNKITRLDFVFKNYVGNFKKLFNIINSPTNHFYYNSKKLFLDFVFRFTYKPLRFLCNSYIYFYYYFYNKAHALNLQLDKHNLKFLTKHISNSKQTTYLLLNHYITINSLSYVITYKHTFKKRKKIPSIKRRKLKTHIKLNKNLYYFFFLYVFIRKQSCT